MNPASYAVKLRNVDRLRGADRSAHLDSELARNRGLGGITGDQAFVLVSGEVSTPT